MRFAELFKEFLENTVNLSPGRLATLEKRVGTIERILRVSEDPVLSVLAARPQGSLAQKTIINPLDAKRGFDADLLVEFEDVGASPKELLRAVREVLKASAKHADMVRLRTRCVTLEYEGEFHLDVVPCVRQGPIPYIANRLTDGWEPTDPVGLTAWLQEHDERANGFLIPSIRLCKYLRDLKGRPRIKSVILTILLTHMVDRRVPADFTDVPVTLVLLLEELASWCDSLDGTPSLTEPTCEAELRLDDTNWDALTSQLLSLAGRARAALEETDEAKSLALWKQLFGSRFPAPALRESAVVLEPGEEDLYLDRSIPTDISATATIKAVVGPKEGFRHGSIDNLSPLQKSRQLIFTLDHTSVPYPYDVYWKVKNRGPVARAVGGLRGEITRDDNAHTPCKYESTAYAGPHYVEIYIVQGGICVAQDRQDVEIA